MRGRHMVQRRLGCLCGVPVDQRGVSRMARAPAAQAR